MKSKWPGIVFLIIAAGFSEKVFRMNGIYYTKSSSGVHGALFDKKKHEVKVLNLSDSTTKETLKNCADTTEALAFWMNDSAFTFFFEKGDSTSLFLYR